MASSEHSVEITYAQKKQPVSRMKVRKAYSTKLLGATEPTPPNMARSEVCSATM